MFVRISCKLYSYSHMIDVRLHCSPSEYASTLAIPPLSPTLTHIFDCPQTSYSLVFDLILLHYLSSSCDYGVVALRSTFHAQFLSIRETHNALYLSRVSYLLGGTLIHKLTFSATGWGDSRSDYIVVAAERGMTVISSVTMSFLSNVMCWAALLRSLIVFVLYLCNYQFRFPVSFSMKLIASVISLG